MSDHNHEHGADDGMVHAHISSLGMYLAIFGALILLTLLTVGQSYVDLGRLNLVAVIGIATLKASLVVLFFMHLKYDNKFNGLMFVASLFFIGVFFAYTLNDVDHRGEFDELGQKTHQAPADKEAVAAPGGYVPSAAASGGLHIKEHGSHEGAGHEGAGHEGAAPAEHAPAHH